MSKILKRNEQKILSNYEDGTVPKTSTNILS